MKRRTTMSLAVLLLVGAACVVMQIDGAIWAQQASTEAADGSTLKRTDDPFDASGTVDPFGGGSSGESNDPFSGGIGAGNNPFGAGSEDPFGTSASEVGSQSAVRRGRSGRSGGINDLRNRQGSGQGMSGATGGDIGGDMGGDMGGIAGGDMGGMMGIRRADSRGTLPSRQRLSQWLKAQARRLTSADNAEEKDRVKRQLSKMLATYFDKDMDARFKELDEVKQRVARMESYLERRLAAKDAVVEHQLKTIVNETEGLGFFSKPISIRSRQSYAGEEN